MATPTTHDYNATTNGVAKCAVDRRSSFAMASHCASSELCCVEACHMEGAKLGLDQTSSAFAGESLELLRRRYLTGDLNASAGELSRAIIWWHSS